MRRFSTLNERYIEALLPEDLPGEAYEYALGELKRSLKERYPESFYNKLSSWDCNLAVVKDGAPSLNSKLTFMHDIWSAKENKNKPREWRIRVEKKRLIVNYCKNLIDDSGSFLEFQDFYGPILVSFQKDLGIQAYQNIVLNHQFKYNCDTLGNKEYATENWVEVKKILKPFASVHLDVPGDFKSFIPPYRWEQTWRLEKDYFLRSCLKTSKENDKISISMMLAAWRNTKEIAPYALLNGLFDKLEIIYRAMLTDEALTLLKDDWK